MTGKILKNEKSTNEGQRLSEGVEYWVVKSTECNSGVGLLKCSAE